MKLATLIISLIFLVIFISGMLAFPEAPIYQKGSEFLGKYGGIYDEEVFKAYFYWSIMAFSSFMATFIMNICLIVVESKPIDGQAAK